MKLKFVTNFFTTIIGFRRIVPCLGCLITKIIYRFSTVFEARNKEKTRNFFLWVTSSIFIAASLLTFVGSKIVKFTRLSRFSAPILAFSAFLSKLSDILFYIAVCDFLILEYLKLKKLGMFSYFLSS
jgi:hypothetical protein